MASLEFIGELRGGDLLGGGGWGTWLEALFV